ncbi:hypothetical protein [Variovorax ginsengisoli]|uniref:DUF58 domain-containing protein n=1 Tax=Variovorax ginsengisoli TaxID=363844 RepID=A0ABT9SDG8_9BURK|nr:hypothetical protein [Variovorax ginsengisoli]MDP9902225.1 hypothetical protein [Variovorax ginsengisoli]
MTTIQARRKLIVIILLAVALGGAAIRHYAAPGSILRDTGTLLMLLWIPIIGNIISWLVARLRRPVAAVPSGFDERAGFTPHLSVELTLRPPQIPAEDTPFSAGEHRCALVVDNQGFSARWRVASGERVMRGQPHHVDVEFLVPAMALPRLPSDSAFRMLVGDSFIGDGRVLKVLLRQ